MVKAYTDIEQSRELATILPEESADMHYSKDYDGSWFVDITEYSACKIQVPKYVDNIDDHLLPCWSLAALLDALPEDVIRTPFIQCAPFIQKEDGKYIVACGDDKSLCIADNPIDACYEMILKLREGGLL